MCDIVRGRGYYVWRIILGEEECDVGDRVEGVDRMDWGMLWEM